MSMKSVLYNALKQNKSKMTMQQYRTIKGQIRSGDYGGAIKGIDKLVKG